MALWNFADGFRWQKLLVTDESLIYVIPFVVVITTSTWSVCITIGKPVLKWHQVVIGQVADEKKAAKKSALSGLVGIH